MPGNYSDGRIRTRSHSRGKCSDEDGSVLVIVAMLVVVLLGFAGLTIDYGYYFSQKTRLQAEADAAAVACGLTAKCKPGAMLAPDNAAVFNPLGFSANDVKVLAINARCPHNPALNSCIEVEAKSTWDTFFVRLFNVSTLTATATAVAVGGQTPQPVVVPSVLATGAGREGIQSHGNAADAVRVKGDIVSNSGIQVNNNSAITLLDGGVARAVGGITGAINGNQEPLKTAMADPCSGLPSPTVPAEKSCKPLPEITGSSCGRTYGQADEYYCGDNWNVNIAQNENKCDITFLGTYVINNTFNFNINPNNSEVHFKDSLIHLKPNANFSANVSGNSSGLKITPRRPGDGSYGGIAIWMSGQNTGFLMNQPNAYVTIGGLVYAPNSSLKIQMSGNGGGNKDDPVSFSGIIASSVNFTNNAQNGDPFIVNPPPSGVCDTGGSSGKNPDIGSPDKTKLVK